MTEDIFYRSILVRCVRLVWTSRRDYFPMQKTTLLRGKHMLWEEKEQSHGWWGLERARLILFCFVFFLFAGKFFVSETPLRDSHTFVSLSAKSSFTESFFFFFTQSLACWGIFEECSLFLCTSSLCFRAGLTYSLFRKKTKRCVSVRSLSFIYSIET